ncbi:hypothetical protein M427DRAFT_62893 [Gonapodya prolifera JEL478]|uniref:Uncharacterized protein n=1 Tax=Gonapodya prolifera (strain JEL478) TaxID=1344416 RepID=A0A139A0L1_GONPJ|nr:hypothetical protein M427DRAFT_62893 [Gonapodya prolifera JEL478]|eukprot:KXS10158.1 hypothetical protein M427DRAFT_62893 [Gonapodya prolifera JEL478]
MSVYRAASLASHSVHLPPPSLAVPPVLVPTVLDNQTGSDLRKAFGTAANGHHGGNLGAHNAAAATRPADKARAAFEANLRSLGGRMA